MPFGRDGQRCSPAPVSQSTGRLLAAGNRRIGKTDGDVISASGLLSGCSMPKTNNLMYRIPHGNEYERVSWRHGQFLDSALQNSRRAFWTRPTVKLESGPAL